MESQDELWGALQHVPFEGLDRVDKIFLVGWCWKKFPCSGDVVAMWCGNDAYVMKLWHGFSKSGSGGEAQKQLSEFVGDCLTLDQDARVPESAVWDAYHLWAIQRGQDAMKRGEFLSGLSSYLQGCGVSRKKSVRIDGRYYRGFMGACTCRHDK